MKGKKQTALLSVEIDQAEVVCILFEEITGQKRPEGTTGREALGMVVTSVSVEESEEMRITLETAASRVIDYVVDEIVRQVPGAMRGRTLTGGGLQ